MSNPPQNKPPQQSIQVSRQELQYFGPIPPPTMLEHYDKVVPGAAERLLKMAEQQSEHRRSLEKTVLDTDGRNSTLGVCCALIIALGFLSLAGYAIYLNHPWAATVIAGVGISSLVGTFIYGTSSRRHERETRFKDSSS